MLTLMVFGVLRIVLSGFVGVIGVESRVAVVAVVVGTGMRMVDGKVPLGRVGAGVDVDVDADVGVAVFEGVGADVGVDAGCVVCRVGVSVGGPAVGIVMSGLAV